MEKITKIKIFISRLIIFAIFINRLVYEKVQIKGYSSALLLILGVLFCYCIPNILSQTKTTNKDYDGVLECKTEENGDKHYKFSINIETIDNKKELLIKVKDKED